MICDECGKDYNGYMVETPDTQKCSGCDVRKTVWCSVQRCPNCGYVNPPLIICRECGNSEVAL